MSVPRYEAVDEYIVERLFDPDAEIAAALAANDAAGLPPIEVSNAQGRMLGLFARMTRARRILEIGTLGGISTIFLARALPEDGKLISLEIDLRHAEVARGNVAAAGLGHLVEVRVGPAIDTLAALIGDGEEAFDLVFIDADKQNNVAYARAALDLSRPGTVIVVDNVVRAGRVIDTARAEPAIVGTRALFDMVSAERRLSATVIQTVGAKGWDGFLLAVVGA